MINMIVEIINKICVLVLKNTLYTTINRRNFYEILFWWWREQYNVKHKFLFPQPNNFTVLLARLSHYYYYSRVVEVPTNIFKNVNRYLYTVYTILHIQHSIMQPAREPASMENVYSFNYMVEIVIAAAAILITSTTWCAWVYSSW